VKQIMGHTVNQRSGFSMKYQLLLTMLFCLAAPSFVAAQFTVNLDPATARFTYFPSTDGPGIPEGVPFPFELHFGMQGSFTIEELTNTKATSRRPSSHWWATRCFKTIRSDGRV
jgi:hypothetical protein